MTDREDFEKWYKDDSEFSMKKDEFGDYQTHEVRMKWLSWQTCDELNKARIAKLELENKTLREWVAQA